MENKTKITKSANRMVVLRNFDAPVPQVWRAWTDSELLDQWWAPKPYKARTQIMNFIEGGFWHYAMVGPETEEMWARFDYQSICVHDYFKGKDSFCDADGVKNEDDFPGMDWTNTFIESGEGTQVRVEITFKSEIDMEKIAKMGFIEGFTAAHQNLDHLLKSGAVR